MQSSDDSSGIAYQLTPTSTCLEGSWDKIITVARLCHEVARREHAHVVTSMRIEDDATADADQYIANAEQYADLQNFWRDMKDQETKNVQRLKELVAEHCRKDCF